MLVPSLKADGKMPHRCPQCIHCEALGAQCPYWHPQCSHFLAAAQLCFCLHPSSDCSCAVSLQIAQQLSSKGWLPQLVCQSKTIISIPICKSVANLLTCDARLLPLSSKSLASDATIAAIMRTRLCIMALQIISSTATRTLQTLDAMRAAVAAFNSADLHSRGSLFTVAAMDGMTLQHLHVRAQPPPAFLSEASHRTSHA